MRNDRRSEYPDLHDLDPGRTEAGYWWRFENRVLAAALPALSRRRSIAKTTLPDVVSAWSRLLVPGAVAAAIAGLLILGGTGVEEPAAVAAEDEVILPGEEGYGTMPGFLVSESTVDRDVVFFAIEER